MTRAKRTSKKPLFTTFSLIALILWCGFIFFMSARVAQDSDALSLGVAGYLLNLVTPGFGDLSPEEQFALAESINHPVRKLAHFSEYLILGMLAFNVLRQHTIKINAAENAAPKLMVPLLSWGFCIIYAAGDEFHQLFVPGRACLIGDVFVDSAGALLGILLLWGARALRASFANARR